MNAKRNVGDAAFLSIKVARLTYLLTHYLDQLYLFVVVTERGVHVRRTLAL
jgi:hypothetical protein